MTVVGSHFRGSRAVELCLTNVHSEGYVIFEKEDYNRYDDNAVRAYCISQVRGRNILAHIGYLQRAKSAELNKLVARRQIEFNWKGLVATEKRYILARFTGEYTLGKNRDQILDVAYATPIAIITEYELDEFLKGKVS
jgi:hypothetical protein